MIRRWSTRVYSALESLVEWTEPVLSGQQGSPLATEGLAELLLQRGPAAFARLAITNDFVKLATLAGAAEREHLRGTYPGDTRRLNAAARKLEEFVEQARPTYQTLLVRYRVDQKGNYSEDPATFWGRYYNDAEQFGFRSPATWDLGSALCEITDCKHSRSSCKRYFATRRLIVDSLLSKAAQDYGRGKLILESEEQLETLSHSRVRVHLARVQSEAESRRVAVLLPPEEMSYSGQERERALAEARAGIDSLDDLPLVQEELRRLEAHLRIQIERGRAGLPRTGRNLHFLFRENPGIVKGVVVPILEKVLHGYGISDSGQVVEANDEGFVAEYLGGHTAIRLEDLRERLVIQAPPYPDWMKEFFESEVSLPAVTMPFYQFANRTVEEWVAMFDRMAYRESYLVSRGARAELKRIVQEKFVTRKDQFSALREVLQLFQEVMIRHALRLAATPRPPGRQQLQTLAKEDIPRMRKAKEPTHAMTGGGYLWISCSRSIDDTGVALSVSARLRGRRDGAMVSSLARNPGPRLTSLAGIDLPALQRPRIQPPSPLDSARGY